MVTIKILHTILRLLLALIFSVAWQSGICQQLPDTTNIHLADPTIFKNKNIYYLYGTVEGNAGNGFLVYKSKDLKSWKLHSKHDGYALKKGESFGTAGFWAPQVYKYGKKFYMAYTANENIAIAEGDDPAGPFRQRTLQSVPAPVKQIDPYVFIDDDGKKYLYHVRLTEGNRIFVAELNDDFQSVKAETVTECLSGVEEWENTAHTKWPVTEGPTVLKFGKQYYLFYSANDFRNPNYAVGFATSNHPMGPWQKHSGNPILHKQLVNRNGPGHGDFFAVRSKLFYVFHTHFDNVKVGPRRSAIIKTSLNLKRAPTTISMDSTTFYFLKK